MSQFDNIPMYSAPMTNNAGMNLTASMPGASVSVEQQRAIAEVQSSLVIARSCPRSEINSRDKILQSCMRPSFAASASFCYPKGGTQVSGPSIRLAETAARCWGNMTYGFREIARHDGESECEAFAWDLESNTKISRQFTVRHRRDTRNGGKAITDEREIYEMIANYSQRRVRACILEIIPRDIIEDALNQCDDTMRVAIDDIRGRSRVMVEKFAEFGVTASAIEARIGHRLDALQPAEFVNLQKIYNAIRDGFSKPEDWFNMEAVEEKKLPPKVEKKKAVSEQKTILEAVNPEAE